MYFTISLCYRLTDKIEMALFVLRYVSCLGIFVLGLRAPGIMSYREFYNIGTAGSEARIPIIEVSYSHQLFASILLVNPLICKS